MTAQLAHRHGRHLHAHAHTGPHRHLLRPRRSEPLRRRDQGDAHADGSHRHSHGLVDASIRRSRAGVRAVLLALAVLGATAAAQALVFVASGSVACWPI